MNESTLLDRSNWYTPREAVARLTANSGRRVADNYPRILAREGLIRSLQVSEVSRLYHKADIDAYVVEDRGKKGGRARQKAMEERRRKEALAAGSGDNTLTTKGH